MVASRSTTDSSAEAAQARERERSENHALESQIYDRRDAGARGTGNIARYERIVGKNVFTPGRFTN